MSNFKVFLGNANNQAQYIGQILDDTNTTKVNNQIDYVIAFQKPTSTNNYTWYRKYASGWVEQGQFSISCPHNSVQTITLPITMSSNYYIVETFGVQIDANGSFGAASTISGHSKSTTEIYIGQQNTASETMVIGWEVKGMAA